MESSFALAGTLQVLKQANLLVARPTDPKHVFIVSNDGIPEELKDIRGRPDRRDRLPAGRPVRQVRAVLRQGRDRRQDVRPGPTDHDSTIIQVRTACSRTSCAAPLVTEGATCDDPRRLWGNNL